jgi:hypothetical protein
MRFHFRKTWRPGPLRITLTEKGPTWGVRAGRYGYNPKTGKHTFNTPLLGGVSWGGRSKRRSSDASSGPRSGGGGGVFGALLVVVILGGLAIVVLSGWPL